MSGKRTELPWHVQARDHVWIYAGGDKVRRMHVSFYVLLVHGQPVESQWLTADSWPDIESFEAACVEYERREESKLILPPLRGFLRV